MTLPKGSRGKTFNLMTVLLRERYVTFNEKYAITHLKTLANRNFYGGYFFMKSKVKEYEVFFKR